ncbi:aldehyde dehydrogenase family protein [Streptomyces sp. OE57]|uniref:aldehyde dehydrogenase family protein n=1 Tax=Streptomyces lacaronensis TaxID=3379885 RepID=UPI0039B761F2
MEPRLTLSTVYETSDAVLPVEYVSPSRRPSSTLNEAPTHATVQWSRLEPADRAPFLEAIASALEEAAPKLVAIADEETSLGETRLRNEMVRTVFQLRLFAETVTRGEYLGATIVRADPAWPMGPRPDLRRVLEPLGPVVVFSASNFPFASQAAVRSPFRSSVNSAARTARREPAERSPAGLLSRDRPEGPPPPAGPLPFPHRSRHTAAHLIRPLTASARGAARWRRSRSARAAGGCVSTPRAGS